MPEQRLDGCHILVVEDEYVLADELLTELADGGVTVLGPVGTLGEALDLIESGRRIDGAVLDVNLGGEMAYPAADALLRREVPFLFTTGYDPSVIPSRFADVVRCEKPVSIKRVMEAMARIVHA